MQGLQSRLKAKGIVLPYKAAQSLFQRATDDKTDFTNIDQLIEAYGLGAQPQEKGPSGALSGALTTTNPASVPVSTSSLSKGQVPPSTQSPKRCGVSSGQPVRSPTRKRSRR